MVVGRCYDGMKPGKVSAGATITPRNQLSPIYSRWLCSPKGLSLVMRYPICPPRFSWSDFCRERGRFLHSALQTYERQMASRRRRSNRCAVNRTRSELEEELGGRSGDDDGGNDGGGLTLRKVLRCCDAAMGGRSMKPGESLLREWLSRRSDHQLIAAISVNVPFFCSTILAFSLSRL